MTATSETTAVRPFTIEVPEADLEDMRARVASTRFPDKETVDDDSQGVPLPLMQDLARYWSTQYDWRACEKRIDGLQRGLNVAPHDRTHRTQQPRLGMAADLVQDIDLDFGFRQITGQDGGTEAQHRKVTGQERRKWAGRSRVHAEFADSLVEETVLDQ